MQISRLFVPALVLSFAACTDSTGESTATSDVPANAPTAAEPVVPTPLPPAFVSNDPGVITSATSFKHAPNEEKKVVDPGTKKEVANWISLLQRGEKVTLLKQDGDYIQIRASDEQIGWVKSDSVLPASEVTFATTLEELKTFARPDFSALNPKKTLPVGSLLFITKTKEPFSEVNVAGTQKLWVLTEKLTTDMNEVEAARIVYKARTLDEKKDATAAQFWDLARGNFGTTKLMQIIAGQEANAAAGLPQNDTHGAEAPAPSAPEAQR